MLRVLPIPSDLRQAARLARTMGLSVLARLGARRCFGANTKGASAVEFALIAPLMIMLMCGIIAFGMMFSVHNGLQELVGEAARASVAGLSATERDTLARTFITNNMKSYPILDSTKITVSTASTTGTTPTFVVSASYNMSSSPIYQWASIVPLPPATITRSAAVQLGGF